MLRYKNDPWLFDLDWNVKEYKLLVDKSSKESNKKKKKKIVIEEKLEEDENIKILKDNSFYKTLDERYKNLVFLKI